MTVDGAVSVSAGCDDNDSGGCVGVVATAQADLLRLLCALDLMDAQYLAWQGFARTWLRHSGRGENGRAHTHARTLACARTHMRACTRALTHAGEKSRGRLDNLRLFFVPFCVFLWGGGSFLFFVSDVSCCYCWSALHPQMSPHTRTHVPGHTHTHSHAHKHKHKHTHTRARSGWPANHDGEQPGPASTRHRRR